MSVIPLSTDDRRDNRKDTRVDRHKDSHVGRRKETCNDALADTPAGAWRDGAMVIVLANQLCRIRHSWFCAEWLVMPSRRSRRSSRAC